jgi:hypothetical protein
MVDSDVDDRFVHLQGGLIVPAPAYLLLLDLEARGFAVVRDGDTLIVRPPNRLTREDCASIRRWKWHLLMLLDYDARPHLDAHHREDHHA